MWLLNFSCLCVHFFLHNNKDCGGIIMLQVRPPNFIDSISVSLSIYVHIYVSNHCYISLVFFQKYLDNVKNCENENYDSGNEKQTQTYKKKQTHVFCSNFDRLCSQ